MSSLPDLAVTGSTGAVGRMVARELASRGVAQRLVARDPSRVPPLPGAAVVRAEYGDREAALRGLEGVRTLFMVSAAESENRLEEHRTFVDAAAEAGVEHVVYTSFLGAAPDSTFTLARDHYATEAHLRARVPAVTALRDNFYLDVLPTFAGEDGIIRGPAGRGRVSAVARADVARSAVAVLLSPDAHRGANYDVTGPEALSFEDVARIVTEVTGRPTAFHDETIEEAYESRRRWDAAPWQYDAWVSTYTAIAAGELDHVSDDVHRLTGRVPLSLDQLLRSTPTPGPDR